MCLCVGLESKIRSCVNYSVLGKEEVDSTQPKGIAAQVLSYSVGRQVLMVSISYKHTFRIVFQIKTHDKVTLRLVQTQSLLELLP
jgi:hypothetical protein